MPGVIDKIRINSGDIAADDEMSQGNARAIQRIYENAAMLGEEIKAHGWLWEPDVKDFQARQENLCQQYEGDCYNYHEHQHKHITQMRELVNDMRVWLDKKLQQP